MTVFTLTHSAVERLSASTRVLSSGFAGAISPDLMAYLGRARKLYRQQRATVLIVVAENDRTASTFLRRQNKGRTPTALAVFVKAPA